LISEGGLLSSVANNLLAAGEQQRLGGHLTRMQITRRRLSIALLVAIQYLALVTASPFLHQHGWDGCGRGSHQPTAITHASGLGGALCPSCEWEHVAKASPPTPLLWTKVERLIARATPPPSEDAAAAPRGLPSSRAPPSSLS